MGFTTDFSTGMRTFWSTFGFIRKNGLWPRLLVPLLLSLTLFIVVVIAATQYLPGLKAWMLSYIGFESWEFWGSGALRTIINILLWPIMIILTLLAYNFVYKYVLLIIMSPLLSQLSEKTEEKLNGKTYPFKLWPFLKDILRGWGMAIIYLAVELILTLFLLLFSLIPIVGFFATFLLFVVQAFFMGAAMMDYYYERRNFGIMDSTTQMLQHKGLTIGLGSGFNLMMMIPVLGSLFAPSICVIASTIAAEKYNNPDHAQ